MAQLTGHLAQMGQGLSPATLFRNDESLNSEEYANKHLRYETADGQIREETGTFEEVDGQKQLVVRGKYSYIGPDGETYQVIYVSDKAGYRPEGDHLPMRKSLKSSMKTVMSTLLKRIQPNLVASLVG
uniref:CSON004603 protein n=1 Tax=Culicoides sonorensis TaxID=179676 RepID=A0A336LXA7_CULSO